MNRERGTVIPPMICSGKTFPEVEIKNGPLTARFFIGILSAGSFF